MALSSQSPPTLPWVLVVWLILPFLELHLSGTRVQPVGLVSFTQHDTALCCLITETALSWRLHRVTLSDLRAVVHPSCELEQNAGSWAFGLCQAPG